MTQAERLAMGWAKYTDLFGEPPHGTVKQMAALLELVPKGPERMVLDLAKKWARMPACRCRGDKRCEPCNVLLELCAVVSELD